MNDIRIDASKGPVSREAFDAAITEANATPAPKSRPITFPKTSDGVWTNRETGIIVRLELDGGGYRPMRPTERGTWIGISVAVRTLAEAKHRAACYVRDSFRYTIGRAYDEAQSENQAFDRSVALAANNPALYDAADSEVKAAVDARAVRGGDLPSGLCLRTDPPHIAHMQAVGAECRNEQAPADPDLHTADVCVAAGGRTHLADDCFASGPWLPRPAFTYAADKPAEDTSQVMWRDGGADYATASEVIANMQIPADFVASKLPPVPDDVDDESGWAAYCAALPTPTRDEVALTLAELGSPYAESIEQCRDTFRLSARVIWTGRRQGTLTAADYRRMREGMSCMRRCIEIYRGLARSWAERELFAAENN